MHTPGPVAVLGIGMMGFPMARRLCEAGYTVHVWNRSREKAERVAPFGATVHDRASGAVQAADVVVTMLENGPVGHDVLFGSGQAALAMRPGTLVIDMASIKPAEATDHAGRLRAFGMAPIDAPVSGGTLGAEQGTLAIMAGGDAGDFARALPVLSVLGRATHVGPDGAGQLAKLANQMIVGVTIGVVAEALLFAARGGADMARVRKAISGGFADSRVLQVHGERMVQRDFAKRGSMAVHLKDMRNAMDTARSLGFDAPVATLFEQLFSDAVANGLADFDQSALFVELARRNGMA